MLDYFALLREPRRPWLDVDLLKEKFLTLSSETHPDRCHAGSDAEKESATRKFMELNAAWQCLREPKERLGHLLDLELGGPRRDAQDVPTAAMDLFFEVGKLCREADAFLAARAKAVSPLVKAQMFGRGLELTERLNEMQGVIGRRREELLAELKELNTAWAGAELATNESRAQTLPLDALERTYRMFSYTARWTGQIQERIVQISF